MKVVGLIAEYNPFHNGHAYHIQKAKELTGADSVIVLMSGDFVQRGAPAVMSKYLRAQMALQAGASAVFELPVCYATGSAELFAYGAVSLLDRLGVVDSLCFGSECDNLSELDKIASVLVSEPEAYSCVLKRELKKGASYPSARQKALQSYFQTEDCAFLLEQPNNILGIEYLKALKKLHSKIRPYTIRRVESDYHETELQEHYSSASSLRHFLTRSEQFPEDLERQVPSSALPLYRETFRREYPVTPNALSSITQYMLLKTPVKKLCRYMDMSEDLARRIKNQFHHYTDYQQFCELLKTKELTYTRISRALLHTVLGIKQKRTDAFLNDQVHYYAHLLGFRKDQKQILSVIKKESDLLLFTRTADEKKLSKAGKAMRRQDVFASNLYQALISGQYHTPFENDLKKSVLKI